MRRRKKPVDEAEVDMTPMLDVVFILLIFFIVTSTFLSEEGMDLTPPPPSPPQENKITQKAVNIYVDETNFIQVDGRITDLSAVRANIERKKAEFPDISVVVQVHPNAKNLYALKVVDEARLANIQNVAFIGSEQ